jgi:hypothetical protein
VSLRNAQIAPIHNQHRHMAQSVDMKNSPELLFVQEERFFAENITGNAL